MLFKKKKKTDIDSIPVKLNVSNPDIIKIIKMLSLNTYDLKYLKNVLPIIESNIDLIIGNFYDSITLEDSLTHIINNNSSMDRLKLALRVHVLEMFDGNIDDQYISKREKIAKIHLRIGLSSKWYCFAFDSLAKDIYKLILENVEHEEDRLSSILALIKIFNLEQNLTLSAYDSFVKQQHEETEKVKIELKMKLIDESSTLSAIAQETYSSYEQLQEQAKNVLSYANQAKLLSDAMEEKANEGKSTIVNQTDSMSNIIETVNKISKDIERVNDINKQVEGIVVIVNNIASQSHLLSLNASIEAAHAKEYGKGFAVVADEVRNLSHDTKTSLQNVNDLLEAVSKESVALKESMQNISASVKQGEDTLIETEVKFMDIMNSTIENKNQSILIENEISELENVIKELSSAFDVIASSADSLSNISQDLLR